MTRRRLAGELLFEAYLAEHEYPEPAYEPDLGVRTRPDYVVVRGEAEAVCEVEEFDPDSGWSPGNAGPGGRRSMEDVLRPVRYKIRAAAKQLKPLAGCGRPLVVVLANPGGAWVGLSPQEIVWAMYGDPAFTFSVDSGTGEAVDEGGFITTVNGKLRNDHPYISAVSVVSERDRAIDFYDELVAGMEDASADEKWRAINAAKDRGEVPDGITTGSTCTGPRAQRQLRCPPSCSTVLKTGCSSTTRKLTDTCGPAARRPSDRSKPDAKHQPGGALVAAGIVVATAA